MVLVTKKLFHVIDASLVNETDKMAFVLFKKEKALSSYAPLLTALTSFIASIIVIPVTITHYLFNREEDKFIMKILEFSDKHDCHNEETRNGALGIQKQVDSSVTPNPNDVNDAKKAMASALSSITNSPPESEGMTTKAVPDGDG